MLQYFDEGRVTDAPNVYANTLGTLVGAVPGSLLTEDIRWPFLSEIAVAPVPTLPLIAWVGCRLFPFLPTLDLHKYWSAIKPFIICLSPIEKSKFFTDRKVEERHGVSSWTTIIH